MSVGLEEMVFLGYRVKEPWPTPEGWGDIELICNVGEDLCEPRRDWFDKWDFNRGFCYGTPEEAWSSLDGNTKGFRLFAYYLLPYYFEVDQIPEKVPLEEILHSSFPSLPTEISAVPGLGHLGFDVAEHNMGFLGFPYSPLVTNGFASKFPVNKYGLCDNLDEAIRACQAIESRMPEHGKHWVFRVLGQLEAN